MMRLDRNDRGRRLVRGALGLAAALSLCPAFAALPDIKPTQPHTINDAGYGMPWATLTLPAGWGYNGGVIHANNCMVMGPTPMYTGESGDHLFGFVVMPALKWGWTSDPNFAAQLKTAGCPLVNSVSAEGFLRAIALPRLAPPGAKIERVGPAPALAPIVQQISAMNEQLQRNSMQTANMQTRRVVDSAKITLSFVKNGRNMRADVATVISCTDQTMSFPVLHSSMRSYDCAALFLAASYAPVEDMDTWEQATAFKLDVNPAWVQHNNQVQQQIMANNRANQQSQFEANQKANVARQNGYDQYNKAQQQHSDAVHEGNQAFAAHMGDYNDFTDPTTVQTVRASNQFNGTYMHSDGSTALQTNQAGSPGVDWTLMKPRF